MTATKIIDRLVRIAAAGAPTLVTLRPLASPQPGRRTGPSPPLASLGA